MSVSSYSFLSPNFLKKYENIKPKNQGIMFLPLFLRTYSRFIPEKQRREIWLETVQRVVEYSMNLYQGPATVDELIKEAELMFDKVFHLEVLPSGRSLWIGGTETANKMSESNFNCSFTKITSLNDFCDIFHLLLCGCGVGYRVLKKDVINLPLLNTKFTVNHHIYNPKHPSNRREDTDLSHFDKSYMLQIGDSRKAWVEALRAFLKVLEQTNGKEITIDISYDSIRPAGERIKTAGGTAPGPFGMREMFVKLERIIKNAEGVLNPVAAMDVANILAENVIVGGTRRSAQIALGDPDDEEFIDAKKNLYQYKDGKWIKDESRQHRTMSNNTVVFDRDPSLDEINSIFNNIRNNGEPGFFNLKAAKARRPRVSGINPCAEILLSDKGVCNLSTVVLSSHINSDNTIDFTKLEESVRLAARIGMRQTNVTLSLKAWDEAQKRDRLTGVSMTGLMDTFDRLGWRFDSTKAQTILESMRFFANDEADKYSYEMRIPRPLLVTALKPEGSLSLLPTVSPGLHRSYAPYYIRRMRVSELDPVCKALQKLGVPNERDITKSNSTRIVFSFPIASGALIAANDEPALDQFNRYLQLQKLYTDHNSSCTLTIGENEWKDIAAAVHKNWNDVVACAFLPKDSMSYPQMPLEVISKEKYEELISNFPNLDKLHELVNHYETNPDIEYELELVDCSSGGHCPIR